MNQLYNKQREHEQKQLAKGKEQRFTSRRLDRITTKRNRRVMHYLHTASRRIIDLLGAEGIGTLIIGKNPFWKQEVELGRRHNQEFVQIPHAKFIEMLPTYDPTQGPEHEEKPRFSGRREGRWYRVKGRAPVHSDVNGSYNIGRKVFPTVFDGLGIEATSVRPRRLAV